MRTRLAHWLSTNWKDVALIAILFLLPLVCFADMILLPQTFYIVDIELVQFPGRVFLADLLREGQLSFWNPYIFMGFPLLAEPEIGPLYPLNLIFGLPIPHYYALTLFLVLHYSLAGVFTYVLARSLKIGRVGSLISALVFAFGGFLVSQLSNMNISTGSVWLPLVLCLFIQALDRRSYGFAVGAGAALAILILPAHPQIILYTLLILGFYYLFSLLTLSAASPRSFLSLSLISLGTVAVGAGLAAIQLIPTFQLQQLSVLSESGGYEFVTAYSLPKFRLLMFLFPNFLGNPIVGYRGEPIFEEHHGYAGILPLILATLAWGKRRDRHVVFFGLVVLISIVLTLGNETPLYRLLAYIPVYNWFRIPARWLLALTLGLGMLAGYGFDFVLEQRGKRPLPLWAKGLVAVAILLTLVLPGLFFWQKQILAAIGSLMESGFDGQAIRTLRALVRYLPQFPDAEQTNLLARLFPPLLNPILFFLLMLDLAVILILLFLRKKISTRVFQVLAVGLVIFDLFLTGGTAIIEVEVASYYDKRAPTAFVEENIGLHRIYSPDREGEAPQKLLDYYPMIHRIQTIGTLPSISVLTPRRYSEFTDALLQNTRLLNLAGVKYILTELEEPPDWWHNNLRKVYSEEGFNIYENLDVLPRAFLVHRAEVPGTDAAILERLMGEEFDLSAAILLEDASALHRLEDLLAQAPAVEAHEEVEIVEYGINHVVIETNSNLPGFLFLSDTLYPGWRATVDGQREPIYRADYAFRAVLVPSGRHTVEFRFNPVGFKIGLTVALFTVLILIVAAVVSRRRSQA